MIFSIKLADLNIKIDCIYEKTYYMSLSYLSGENNEDICININQQDIDFEKTNYKNFENNILLKNGYGDNYFEYLAVYRKIAENVLPFNIILVHGVVVAVNDKAFMFIAPSGVGKSTHAKLWLKNIEGAYVVNGDKPLLRFYSNEIRAFGTPWAGKEGWSRNCGVPLNAVCIIERSKENTIERIDYKEIYKNLLKAVYIPKSKQKAVNVLNLIDEFEGKVKFYKLFCNTEDEAAKLSYQTMNEN